MSWWTEISSDALQGYESVGESQPFGTQNSSVQSGTSDSEYLNWEDFIDLDLLATHEHEPHDAFPLEITQAAGELSAQNSQFQFSPDNLDNHVQQPPLGLQYVISVADANKELESHLRSSSSLSSSESCPTSSASPTSSGPMPKDVPDGKKEISSTWATFACSTCKEAFANESRYRKHMRQRNCTVTRMKFTCKACERPFQLGKDLKRHQGLTGSATSCPALKASNRHFKQFACSCDKHSYTRKDSLQRHMNRDNAREGSQLHRCKTCQRCRCCCQPHLSQ